MYKWMYDRMVAEYSKKSKEELIQEIKKIMKKWITKQSSAFVLGFLDKLKEFRSTPDNVVEALNIVTEYITNKYWHWN